MLAGRVAAGLIAIVIALPIAAAPRKKAAAAPVTPPTMQLGSAVKPLAYEAELTIVPTHDRFTGHVVIHVEIAKATELFWLNATRLDIRTATLVANGKSYPARIVPGGRDYVGMRFASAVPAGRAVLTLDYDGAIDRIETSGVFKQQDGDHWYVFTQFQATDARRAFPCFDEPGWKTPWHLTLVVPAADVAVANTPVTREEPVAAPIPAVETPVRKGSAPAPVVVAAPPAIPMKRVHFAPTAPLPSYLIAFAVGPFDVVDGGRAGKKGTPLRYIVPKGRAGEVAYAKEATPKLLDLLEEYFGQPYPYEKLDSVALPITVGFGAMENVGLVAYEMPLMLARPDQETERFRRWYAGSAAHELTHMWFGHLVTMQWWNDVWLSESFATWLSAKTIERFAPAWQTKLSGDARRQQAIAVDRLSSTRQVRQPVNNVDDLGNAFDTITYEKGAAVMAMFETAIGEERFRNGVRRYLYEHANGNAKSEDFMGAIAAEAGPEYAPTIAGIRTFVEQPGVPKLAVALDCGPDGNAPPKLAVAQSRYLPSKPAGDAGAQRWTFPACFQFGRGGDFDETCALIQEARSVIPLPSGERCPQWVLPNRGGSSYFVSMLPLDLMQQLTRTPLLAAEAIPVLHDAATLTASSDWPADLTLEFAGRYVNHRQLPVAQAALELAMTIRPSWLYDAGERETFARYVQKTFGARARAFGWVAKSSDREGDAIHRQSLVPWVADLGNDVALQREATRLSREWLGSKGPLPSGSRAALITAARFAQGPQGRELLDALFDALGRATNQDRPDLIAALGSFRDRTLADAAFDGLFEKGDARDGLAAMRLGAAPDEVSALVAIRYLRPRYDALARKLPEHADAWFARLGSHLCDPAARSEFESSVGEKVSRVPGGPRRYAQSLEEIGVCVASRQTQHAALKAYLAKQ